jgi:tRNA threonylcarbamoyladenosine biosynthesis protein TsaE
MNPGTTRRRRVEQKTTHSETETFRLAAELAREFKGKEVVLLTGELGAGKTVFAKGIAAGLGCQDHTQVCSPSYTLVNIYKGKCPIFHIDLFRLQDGREIADLGLEDFLDEGVVIVEWAEKLDFPIEGIRVRIEIGKEDERKIQISF